MTRERPPRSARRGALAPSSGAFDDNIANELRHAGDRDLINSLIFKVAQFVQDLDIPPEYRKYIEFGRAVKRDFAQRFSTALAQKIADGLRPQFRGVLPDEHGRKHESKSGSASGPKKLDVNYSTPSIGLGLGVSIKTLNFRDEGTGRFTKNIKRLDGELRAEAQDYHTRQPYAVLAALAFLPEEAASDSERKSSLKHAAEVFRSRAGRRSHAGEAQLFERFWVCVYASDKSAFGQCRCYDVMREFPVVGLPEVGVSLSEAIAEIAIEFERRNKAF